MLGDIGHDQIRSEIEQIQDLFIKFGPLLGKSETEEPDRVELSALGTILHSFYTGLERIFLVIVKRIDPKYLLEIVGTWISWNRSLCQQTAAVQ